MYSLWYDFKFEYRPFVLYGDFLLYTIGIKLEIPLMQDMQCLHQPYLPSSTRTKLGVFLQQLL